MNKINAILIGGMNVGKTTLFSWITGGGQQEETEKSCSFCYNVARIKGSENTIYDIPGISGFIIQNEEDKLAVNLLLNKEINTIIEVLDAKNIRRGLALAFQMAEFNIPMVFCLNMVDEAQSRGIIIDARKLESIMMVPVNETVANEKQGIDKLLASLGKAGAPRRLVDFPPDIENAIREICAVIPDSKIPGRALALYLLCKNNHIEDYIRKQYGETSLEKLRSVINGLQKKYRKPLDRIVSEKYFFQADHVARKVLKHFETEIKPPQKALSRYTTRLFPGALIALAVVVVMYLFVGVFGASFLVSLLEGKLFGKIINPAVVSLLSPLNSKLVTDFFCGEFGFISTGLSLAFGVVFPVLLTFYIFLGFMEDSGYLPRLSVLLDKGFRKIGLNGKGVLPLIMGFSCITMALLTTRMLDTKKERIISALILMLGMPCAPLLSVMFIIFAKLHWSAIFFVFGVIILQVLLAGFIANKIVPGKRSDFIMEVPVLRVPHLLPILKRAMMRIKSFMTEAVPVFLIVTVIMFVFDKIGGLNMLRALLTPVIHQIFGLPGESVEVLIMTLVRREAGAALLDRFFDGGIFSGTQAVVMLIIMTLNIPCVNAAIVLFKERGVKIASGIIGFVFLYSLFVGAAVNIFLHALGIKF